MRYYMLPLVVNDRRVINLRLNEQEHTIENKHYLIEIPDKLHFNVLALLKETNVKSLIPSCKDLATHNFDTFYQLQNQELKIIFKVKNQAPPEPAIAAKEEEKPAVTYDDLESYEIKTKKKEEPIMPSITSAHHVIGSLNNSIELEVTNRSNGSFLIIGSLNGSFNNLLNSDHGSLKINIELHANNTTYFGGLICHWIHPEEFLGLALDFGSESSQLAVKRYQKGVGDNYEAKKVEHENLFKNMLSYYKFKGWIPRDDDSKYYQEEVNTDYYKSIFFLKERLSGTYENIDKELYIRELNDNLKMLVSSSTRDWGYVALAENKFHQLPNLKIAHKYIESFGRLNFNNVANNGYETPLKLNDVKNKAQNSILKTIVASFLIKEFTKYNAKRKIRFVLLVPNIYDYYDIKNIQQLLHEIFKEFSENEYQDKLIAWEILTISESDASFLGYMNKKDVSIKKNSHYIIIDAGKGTTDFSVIKTGEENIYNINPVYRNGFAGAGNLISYSIFETLIHYIRAHAKDQNIAFKFIRDQILKNLDDSNLEMKNKFYAEIERLKYNFNNNKNYVLSQWRGATSGDYNFRTITEPGSTIDTLINLLSNLENITDFYGYIQEACDLIAERALLSLALIKNNIEQFNSQGVILTGRAFLFQPLEEKVKSSIAAKLNLQADLIHTLKGNELKDVCIKGVFSNVARINAEQIGVPIQIYIPQNTTVNEGTRPAVERDTEKNKLSFGTRLMNIFFNELKEIESTKAILNTEVNANYQELAQSQILIGSKRYKIGSGAFFDNNDTNFEADVTFTPDGYVVRKKEHQIVKNIFPLIEIDDENNIEKSMVIPSLFPNYIDEQYAFSIKRDDIKKAPIIPELPQSNPKPNDGNKNTPKFF